jgi:hypothetical protein
MRSIFIYLFSAACLMGAGRVQTRDGRTLEGEVAFEEGAVVVRAGGETRVPFDQVVRVSTRVAETPKVEVAAAGAALPEGWKAQDIGGVKFPGSAACDAKGVFGLTASGWGAWGAKDSLHFAYRTLRGDGQVIAHVGKLDVSRGPVVAGAMIRQSLAPDAPMAGACLYPSGEVRLPRRPTGSAKDFKPAEEAAPPTWVRLTRRGEVVTAFRSTDGKFWQQVDTHKVPMEENVLVGVAAWTTGNAWAGTAQVDSVTIVPGTPTLTYFPGAEALGQGIVLRDGNVVAAKIVAFDPAAGVKYERDGTAGVYPAERVARLIFNPVPPDMGTPSDKPGVLLASGDFIDGEVGAMSLQPVEWPRPPQLKATVRSVLFGAKSLEVAKEVVAVDFAAVTPAPASYEVRAADGSVTRAKTVTVGPGGAIVDGQLVADVLDIRKL